MSRQVWEETGETPKRTGFVTDRERQDSIQRQNALTNAVALVSHFYSLEAIDASNTTVTDIVLEVATELLKIHEK